MVQAFHSLTTGGNVGCRNNETAAKTNVDVHCVSALSPEMEGMQRVFFV